MTSVTFGSNASPCSKCERGSMHYPNQCTTPCQWGDHDIKATYQNYGYFRAQCSKCMRVWEVDSSG
jgi:hypothetical protein